MLAFSKSEYLRACIQRFAAKRADDEVFSDMQVETLKQFARRVGITQGQARRLVQNGQLEYVTIGCRKLIVEGAWEKFITTNKVSVCLDVTQAPDYAGLPNAGSSTSSGANAVAAASAQLARATANKLKSCSPSGCTAEDAEQAQVVPLRSS
jgi:hypothetical protein